MKWDILRDIEHFIIMEQDKVISHRCFCNCDALAKLAVFNGPHTSFATCTWIGVLLLPRDWNMYRRIKFITTKITYLWLYHLLLVNKTVFPTLYSFLCLRRKKKKKESLKNEHNVINSEPSWREKTPRKNKALV